MYKFLLIVIFFCFPTNTTFGQNKKIVSIKNVSEIYNSERYKNYWKSYNIELNKKKLLSPNYSLHPTNVWVDNYYLMYFPGGCYNIQAKDLSAYITNDTLNIVWNMPWWDCPPFGEHSSSFIEIEVNKKLYPKYKNLKDKFDVKQQKDIYNRIWIKNILTDSLDYLFFKKDSIITYNTKNKNIQTKYKTEISGRMIPNCIHSEIINSCFDLQNDTLKIPYNNKQEYYTPFTNEYIKQEKINFFVGLWKTGMGDGGQPIINLNKDATFIHRIPSCTNKLYSTTGKWVIDNEYLYLFNDDINNLVKLKYSYKNNKVEINTDDKTITNHWSKIKN